MRYQFTTSVHGNATYTIDTMHGSGDAGEPKLYARITNDTSGHVEAIGLQEFVGQDMLNAEVNQETGEIYWADAAL